MRKRLFTSILSVVFALSMMSGSIAVFAEDEAFVAEPEVEETTTEAESSDITEDAVVASEEVAANDEAAAEDEFVVETEEEELVAEDEQIDAVAKIGDTEYETFDAAWKAAVSGDTVELLKDCEASNLSTNGRTLTVKGNYSLSYTGAGISVHGSNLTFDGCKVTMNIANSSGGWIGINIGGATLLLTNGAVLDLNGSSATSNTHAIYATGGNTNINVAGGSVLNIHNFKQDAIEWDGTYKYCINVTGGSKFISNNNRSAITGTWTVTVSDSTMDWNNCSGNGSNGSAFYLTNATLNVDMVGAHGLSASDIIMKNSHVTAKNVSYCGITLTGKLDVDGTSTILCDTNGTGYTGAGLRLAKAATTGNVASGAVVTITNTKKNGLENYGTLTFADGVVLTIKDNDNVKDNGGGIYNGGTITLPANAVITNNKALKTGGGIVNAGTIVIPESVKLYNNHAGNAGDDIYQREAGSVTFGKTGSDWVLDDCGCPITGWFYDGYRQVEKYEQPVEPELPQAAAMEIDETRWSVKGCELADGTAAESTYAKEYTVTEGAVTGILALKAAHSVYRVSYHDNVEGTAFDDQVNDDQNYDDPTPGFDGEPTRDGYEFVGWTDEEGGDVVITIPEKVTGNADYYAVWKKLTTQPPTEDPKDPGSKNPSGSPSTSDETDLMSLFGLMGASLLGIYAVARRRRDA